MTMAMVLKIAKRKAYTPYLQVQPVQHHKQALTYYLKILSMIFKVQNSLNIFCNKMSLRWEPAEAIKEK